MSSAKKTLGMAAVGLPRPSGAELPMAAYRPAPEEALDGDLDGLDIVDEVSQVRSAQEIDEAAGERIVQDPTGEVLIGDSTGEIISDVRGRIVREPTEELLGVVPGEPPVRPPARRASVPVPRPRARVPEEGAAPAAEPAPRTSGFRMAPEPRLRRPLFSKEAMVALERKRWPAALLGHLAELKVLHAVVSGAVLVVLVLAAVIIASAGGDEARGAAASAAGGDGAGGGTPGEGGKTGAPDESPRPGIISPPPAGKALAVPDPGRGCKPLSAYPDLPWWDSLAKLLRAADKPGICELLGASPQAIAAALGDAPHFGPTGYDLLPGGEIVELFPGGRAERWAPTIELLFAGGKLFEIRLRYGASGAPSLADDVFEPLLGKPAEAVDLQKRDVRRYADGDLVVEQLAKKDRYRRVFREVVFSSQAMREALGDHEKERQKAEAAFAAGMDHWNLRETTKAVASFQEARGAVQGFGAAYVWEGMVLLRGEKFDEAAEIAGRALELSRDGRARAEASWIRGVAALYNGGPTKTLALFREAKVLDPINPEFASSVSELETGAYRAERVAKTAARMSCKGEGRKRKRGGGDTKPAWTTEGLLARGNFPDAKAYFGALEKAKSEPSFKGELERWVSWECR